MKTIIIATVLAIVDAMAMAGMILSVPFLAFIYFYASWFEFMEALWDEFKRENGLPDDWDGFGDYPETYSSDWIQGRI